MTSKGYTPVSQQLPKDADDYTINLFGGIGNCFTPIKLTRIELNVLLKIQEQIRTHSRVNGSKIKLIVYYGHPHNIGSKDEPIWIQSGQDVALMKARGMT